MIGTSILVSANGSIRKSIKLNTSTADGPVPRKRLLMIIAHQMISIRRGAAKKPRNSDQNLFSMFAYLQICSAEVSTRGVV